MDEQQPSALSHAREDLDAAAARLRRLKRSVAEPRAIHPRPQRWRVLRRMIESLREVFSGWAAFREDEAAAPEQRRAQRELEARALRAESALAELEAREKALDEDRSRALAELERVREGWRLLRQQAAPRGEIADERTMSAILGRLQLLVVESEQTLAEERAAQREATQADEAWRWIVSVAFPTFEQRLTDADATMTLPTMRRLVKEIDRRWRAAHQAWKSERGFPAALDEVRAAQERAETAERQTAELVEAQRRENEAALERVKVAWRLEATELGVRLGRRIEELESVQRSLESANAELARGREAAEAAVEPLQRERATWQQLSEAARADLDLMLERAKTDESHVAQLKEMLAHALQEAQKQQAELKQSALEVQQLKAALAVATSAASQTQAPAAAPSQAPAAAPEIATPSDAPAPGAFVEIPSIEPVLEPAWQRVLERLRQPLETGMAHLRRVFATPMPEGHRALIRLSAGSLAQAADIIRVVREFLDEGAAAGGSGRLETAVDAALSAWEPALARRGVIVTRLISRGLPTVGARTESLRMAAYHLIRNAFEAMPHGGTLTVKVWRDEASGEARASFGDSGPGLPQDASSLFSPFLSNKPGHLGLGLALSRRIARRAGGELEAGAGAARGALLTLRLPPEAKDAPALG